MTSQSRRPQTPQAFKRSLSNRLNTEAKKRGVATAPVRKQFVRETVSSRGPGTAVNAREHLVVARFSPLGMVEIFCKDAGFNTGIISSKRQAVA